MNVTDFIDYMKEEFSSEKIEKNENSFLEYFFYYKRNIRDFLVAFKTCNINEQKKIITFLLHLYPLSDNFISDILNEMKLDLANEIMFDTINYICSAFIEEFGDLKIDLNEEIKKQKKYDKLNTEKNELGKQFDKIKHDLNELNKYTDLRENIAKCREILKQVGLPKDYTDKMKPGSDV